MVTKIFVISDLHLGGSEGFQMCSQAGRERLVDFVQWVAKQRDASSDQRLVIAGDVVDFLAEREADGGFAPFSETESAALGKLNRIIRDTKPFWTALGELCAGGTRLTLLLGNHDIELSFLALRARLAAALGGAPIQFLYDNEAFSAGPLLIEHGNRYEGFNQVDHDGLRRFRSQLSRKEPARSEFVVQPGSRMVSEVMNRIKEKYSFVDLLKPETAGVVPILAALDGRIWSKAGAVIKQAAEAWYRGGVDSDGVPKRRGFIAATTSAPAIPAGPLPDQDVFDLADELAAPEQREDRIGAVGDLKVSLLLRAFAKRREKDATTFDVTQEAGIYLDPAKAIAGRGFGVVVMGHTHLAKRVPLSESAVYLNTGTWADLMRLPSAVYEQPEEKARAALQQFLEDIKANRIERYRRPVPTFAHIEIAGDAISRSEVLFYDGDGKSEPVTTDGMLKRLDLPRS